MLTDYIKSKRRFGWVLICIGLLSAHTGFGDSPTNDAPLTNTAPILKQMAKNPMEKKIAHAHDTISSNVIETAMWIDSFFGTRQFNRKYTGTRLTLSTSIDWTEGDGVSEGFGLNGKIALPIASDRFQLEFESVTVRDEKHDHTQRDDESPNVDHAAGIRYNFFKHHQIEGHITTGAKLSWGIYPYVKGELSKNFLQEPWNGILSQSLYWYTDRGVGTTSELDLDRSVGQTSLLRSTTAATWSEDSQGLDFGQGLYFMYGENAKNNTHGYIIELAMAGHTEPHTVMDRYRIEFKYRRRTIWNWFYLELAPALEFPRDRDYDPTPKFSLSCDIIFGGE